MTVQSPNAILSDPHPAPKPPTGKSFFAILKETVGDWVSDNAMRLSAALSLYTILSLAPLLVVTLKVVSVIWRNKEAARHTMETQLANLMGSQAAGAVESMLNNGGKHGSGIVATVISFVVLLFSATGVFIELQGSMNTIWGVEPKPHQGIKNFIRSRLLSL
ncbi:MAG TPA: YhjD/YihY/BrkB family envelope integrity protein, partial [Tepidisphaeraceae bacterium]|nr:YhjD/YihY/BrkB family envelope integrity protein [Tepidisphaeraceae bacterium]